MGEASGSQLRIWNAGTPAAVTREGWYAELSEDTVYFIDQESEISQLQSLFHKIDAINPYNSTYFISAVSKSFMRSESLMSSSKN